VSSIESPLAPDATPGAGIAPAASAAPMLCVSIHDVAPATWSDCLRLVQAVREVADIPLTWLVVPHYHFRSERSPAMEACLKVVVERGDELALHGYSHVDTEADGGGLRGRFLRNLYTRREGEFAALDEAEARHRLELGRAWFAERGWTPSGFVPPAWLLGLGAWRALRASGFAYTTTFRHFHCLGGPDGARERSVLSPSLVYAARNRGGRLLSRRVADATAAMLAQAPLVRFSLHPPDARYPELIRHTQRVLERLLEQREAVTKAECARRLMLPEYGYVGRDAAPARHASVEIVLPVTQASAQAPLAQPAAMGLPDAAPATAADIAPGAAIEVTPEAVDGATTIARAAAQAQPGDAQADAPADEPLAVPSDASAEARAEASVEARTEASAEAPAAESVKAPAEAAVKAPAEAGTAASAEVRIDAPADAPAETAVTETAATQTAVTDFGHKDCVTPTFAREPQAARRPRIARATSTAPTSRPASGPYHSRHSSAEPSRSAAGRPSR